MAVQDAIQKVAAAMFNIPYQEQIFWRGLCRDRSSEFLYGDTHNIPTDTGPKHLSLIHI